MSGKLILVPTPIGNLEDITLRALRTLKEADAILVEDTRQSGKLLKHYDIQKPMVTYHMHNEHKALEKIVAHLKEGKTLALITDAGTPGISDPGFLIVRECVKQDISVECLPGATAFVPALVKSGLPANAFTFIGFLPDKKGRQTAMTKFAEYEHTIILYEAPHRVVKTISQLADYLGPDREASVSRELTKMFEQTVNGTLSELVIHFTNNLPKGEFVIVIHGKTKPNKNI